MHYNLQAYYKIKKCAEEINCEEHIYAIQKMINTFIRRNEIVILWKQHNIFGWNIFKWYSNYKEYYRHLYQYMDITKELTELLTNLVEEYNKAVEELQVKQAKAELESKTFVVKGFQAPPKKRRRKKKDE